MTIDPVRMALRRPVVLRYLGLSGAVCLAIDAYLYGAFTTLRIHVTLQAVATGPRGPLILALWVVGTGAMCTAWWAGRHLVGRGLVTVKWVLVTAVMWMMPFAVAPPTGSRDVYAYACQGALYSGGLSPYRVGVSALPCPWLDSVSYIWRDTPAPYGPVFLMLAGLASRLGSQVAAIAAFRLMSMIGVAIIAIGLPALARRVGVPADRAIWLVLACPLLPVHLIGGAHNDALTVGLLVAGLAVLAPVPDGIGAADRIGATDPTSAVDGLGAIDELGAIDGLGAADPTSAVDGIGAADGLGAADPTSAAGGLGAAHRMRALIAGGVLVGLAIAVKTTVGIALPFAALFAAGVRVPGAGGGRVHGAGGGWVPGAAGVRVPGGGLGLPPVPVLVKRAGTVMAAALGTLLAFSFGSGLGVGWVDALSHAGDSISWTSPPTAVGLAADYLGRAVGVHLDAVPVTRAIALVALPIVLVLTLWHSRNHNPLHSAGLAMLATIFLAPITQPWYLIWPLAMFAVTNVSARWFAGAIVVSMFFVLPDGTGMNKITQLPAAFAMTALVGWTIVHGLTWLRGFEPKEIDFEALRVEALRVDASGPAERGPTQS